MVGGVKSHVLRGVRACLDAGTVKWWDQPAHLWLKYWKSRSEMWAFVDSLRDLLGLSAMPGMHLRDRRSSGTGPSAQSGAGDERKCA